MKIDLNKQLDAAMHSSFALRKLNWLLWLGIPFNHPHGIRIHEVEADAVTTRIDLKRKNTNHIRGIHACGLATAAEFCSGLVLLRRLDPRKYRLIMQKMTVEYHYQAKKDALARYSLSDADFDAGILSKMEKEGVVLFTCEVPVHDIAGNHLCTAYTTWQVKGWDKVRTKK
ncbi:MAG: DUF4442 domain-containing protein [Cryomorphaceae bacterium]|nr:DUF4442 domain-containing protein [Flavobacteriales bacterium]